MRTERVFVCLFIIVIIQKALHISDGGLIFILSAYGISLLYLVGAFYFFSDESIKRQNLPLSIISGILLAMAPIAILYKMEYIVDGAPWLIASVIASGIVLVTVLILRSKASAELKTYYRNMRVRSMFLFIITTILLLIPTRALMRLEYYNDAQYATLKANCYENPDNKANQKALENYANKHYPSHKQLQDKKLR